MRRRLRATTLACSLLVLACFAGGAYAAVPRSVFANGGATAAGPGRIVKSSIGQPIVGVSARPGSGAAHGFWSSGAVRLVGAPREGPAAAMLAIGFPTPNPARDRVSLELALTAAANPRLEIYDVCGRSIGTLDPGPLGAGRHRLEWSVPANRERVPAGVYFAHVAIEGRSAGVRRFVVVR